jgi:hypothetical protein
MLATDAWKAERDTIIGDVLDSEELERHIAHRTKERAPKLDVTKVAKETHQRHHGESRLSSLEDGVKALHAVVKATPKTTTKPTPQTTPKPTPKSTPSKRTPNLTPSKRTPRMKGEPESDEEPSIARVLKKRGSGKEDPIELE